MYWICGNLADHRGLIGQGCIRVTNGVIDRISKKPAEGERVKDYTGRGLLVAPGFIDIHVHLRGLEYSYKETEETGGWAAARAGITLVIDMPNTRPPASTPSVVKAKLEGLAKSPVDHSLFAGIPQDLRDFEAVTGMPIAGFKVYPSDLEKSSLAEVLAAWKGLVVLHPELTTAEKVLEEEIRSRTSHRGCWLEAAAVDLVASLSPASRIHVTHASCPSTVYAAKRRGYTVDVTPHHLYYDYYSGEGCSYKVNPPLRGPWERWQLVQMLLEGIVDAVASDHAPHAPWEKGDPLYCSPGIPWLEVWPWLLHRLVDARALSIGEFHMLAGRKPAEILGLEGYGSLEPGSRANIVVYDPRERRRFEGPRHSKARHYIAAMEELVGWPVEVIVGGETVYSNDEPIHAEASVNPFTWRRP